MIRLTLTIGTLAILSTASLAQNSHSILPVPELKNAGTYHAATGTWTRGESSLARANYEILYDNTCIGSFYIALEQKTFHDDGRLPSTSSPQVDQDPFGSGTWMNTSLVGTADAYDIQLYQIAYCTGVAAPMTALTLFYECYSACSDASNLSPTFAMQLSGLPGSSSPGMSLGCWIVNIDLLGATLAFKMNGDCDGTWNGSPAADNFGYAYMQLTPDPAGISGPILAGDPDGLLLGGGGSTGCCVGCATIFWSGTNVPGVNSLGSGLNNQDMFEIDDYLGGGVFTYNGCYWFGGYSATSPYASMRMEIRGSGDNYPPAPPRKYCFGHTSQGNPCPCSNDNDQSNLEAGCANGTFAAGASLDATGIPRLAADTIVLQGTRGQPNNSSMFFQALNDLDGNGAFLGDGIRCAGGFLKRLKVTVNDAGGNAYTTGTVISARSAQLGDVLRPGDVRRYQWWYRDTNNPPCGTGVNDSNTSNGLEINWLP